MISNQLNLANVVSNLKAIYKNEGEFNTEDGRTIEFENYTVILEIDGTRIKAKVDKAFTEIMTDIVNDNNLPPGRPS